ncbi:porin [Rhizobiales bacterium TNE-4]|nr:porin [Rhizobiales bacterium TNE-4]MBV1827397.1 porin [Rhizobiales bacterium TNE-4]
MSIKNVNKPDEYVRVCSAHGAGFFYIPGSDTCIKIGGRVRFEYGFSPAFNRTSNVFGMRALGRFELDARTSTEYGLLRAYTRVNFARRTGGQLYSGTQVRIGTAYTGTGYAYTGNTQTHIDIDRAFIQFGGLTAGRAVSFFGFYNGDLELIGTTAGDGLVTNLAAYTATFGSGFSATLSVEDPLERRNAYVYANGTSGAILSATTAAQYGGAIMPDFVLALRADQSWGSAQLSGMIHQVRTAGLAATAGVINGNAVGSADYGWALNAGVKVNLPMLAKGDAFYLQGTYSQGASTTVLANPQGWGSAGSGVGRLSILTPDAVVTANGQTSLVSIWGITAAMLHYWTPTIRQGLFASYVGSDVPAAAFVGAGGTATTNTLVNAQYWTVGTNVIWSPIKGLDIGAEVNYLQLNTDNNINGNQAKYTTVGATYSEGSAVVGRIRIQRDF